MPRKSFSFVLFFSLLLVIFGAGCQSLRDDRTNVHQDARMKKELDDEAALVYKTREIESQTGNEGKKKEKDTGDIFMSDRGREIWQNLSHGR